MHAAARRRSPDARPLRQRLIDTATGGLMPLGVPA